MNTVISMITSGYHHHHPCIITTLPVIIHVSYNGWHEKGESVTTISTNDCVNVFHFLSQPFLLDMLRTDTWIPVQGWDQVLQAAPGQARSCRLPPGRPGLGPGPAGCSRAGQARAGARSCRLPLCRPHPWGQCKRPRPVHWSPPVPVTLS